MIVRSDARAKASGKARYTADLTPRGLLHGVVVRSPLPAARIVSIDVAEASSGSGVVAFVTANDLPDRRFGIITEDEPLLARDVVRYIGEPVALVAAASPEAAAAAAARIRIEYEPLPAVAQLDRALASDSPRVHDRANVFPPARIRRGEADAAFASAHLVVEATYRSHRVHQGYIEPRAALAELEDDGRLVVTCGSQAPFTVRTGVARLLDLPVGRLRVRVPALGGGFGGKLHLAAAPHAAALCLATGRPVRLVWSRSDELQAGSPRENSIIRIASAVDADGRLVGRRLTVYLDAGAYAYDTEAIASTAALQSCGPYAVGALEVDVHAVYTNTAPTGSMRGPSGPQMVFANESHLDEIAARLGLSPLEIRRRNLVRDGDLGPTGQVLADPAALECLESAAAVLERWAADDRPLDSGRLRGHGLAAAWWTTNPGASAATVTLEEDGTATVASGATEIGTGAVVAGIPALVADELGLTPDQVRVSSGDTDAGYDVGSEGSRTMYGAGNAALAAARSARALLAQDVAGYLEVDPSDLVLRGGRITVAGAEERSLSVGEAVTLARSRSGPVVGSGRFQAPAAEFDRSSAERMPFPAANEPTFHCHVAEVEVEVETGRVHVPRYAAVHDTGRIANRAGVIGQIEGGVVQGIGYALWEEVLLDEHGRTLNADLVDYRMPTAADIPGELVIETVETHPARSGPRGAKGVGEAPVILPAAALAAALRDATGVAVAALPLSAERVADALSRAPQKVHSHAA